MAEKNERMSTEPDSSWLLDLMFGRVPLPSNDLILHLFALLIANFEGTAIGSD
jgi:hypothetical protein